MNQCIRLEIECKMVVYVPTSGASADEIALALHPVRDEIGRKSMETTIEAVQDYLLGRSRLPEEAARHECWSGTGRQACGCRTFVRQGFRAKKRQLRTPLGTVEFRLAYVSGRRCGTKYAPVLGFLGIEHRQRRLRSLEKVVAEIVSLYQPSSSSK